jgi:arabinose-5-phosphate isomerase
MHDSDLSFARQVLHAESEAILSVIEHLGPAFTQAVELITRCADQDGTVLLTGLGKSGYVGAKISATMASLGIPSHSVHPTEAAHGDLGRFRTRDVVIAISFSGETDEVVDLCSILRQDGLKIISITNGLNGPSSLQRVSTVCLTLNLANEAAAPDFSAPTSSTTATMALGDALALASARRRNFTTEDFAKRHPGGSLGGLLRPVTEFLRHAGPNMPAVDDRLSVDQALGAAAASGRRPGAILLIDAATGTLSGIFTDGDLRRLILRDPTLLHGPVAAVMTRSPRTLSSSALLRDAVRMVREHRQDEIPVVDDHRRPVGILDVQDLIALRLVSE